MTSSNAASTAAAAAAAVSAVNAQRAAASNTNKDRASNRLFDIDHLKNDGSNYQIWSSQMRLILQNRNLWGIVDESEPSPPANDPQLADWQAREWDAQAQILLMLETDPYTGVIAAATSKEAWDSLHNRYLGTGLQTAALHIAAIFQTKLTDDELLEAQINV
jgi:hypothetical protein